MNILLGDWTYTTPSYYPAVGTTYIRDILGGYYNTTIMPDGKEWMAENLAYTGGGIGVWFGGAGSDNGFGRYYLQAEKDSIAALLTDGWHVPTYAEWSALSVAAGKTVGGASFSLAGALPNWKYATGTNTTGFSALAAGYRSFGTWDGYASNPSYYANNPELRFWLSDMLGADTRYGAVSESPYAPYGKSLGYGTLNTSGEKALPIRLVRDVALIPAVTTSGTHDILLSKPSTLSGNMLLTGGLDQRIDCALRTFQGEWWLDPSEGVPYFTEIFKKNPDLSTVRQALASVIHRVPGVQRIDRLEVSLNRGTRVLSVDFTVTGTDKVAYYRVTEVAV